MFVAAYDDRPFIPEYCIHFIRNATAFCDLHLITPADRWPKSVTLSPGQLETQFQRIDPAGLPTYRYVKRLFDDVFVNYSTNLEAFERACFHRWFALNASTTFLSGDDYICMLDTDFVIGMSPSDVLSQCMQRAESNDIQFVAEWDEKADVAIGPEIAIMTKAFLYGFCEYLLTTYFSPSMRGRLVSEYFERIGNGLEGGICDMRALAAYVKEHYSHSAFNLRRLDTPQIIGNLNAFLESGVGQRDDWKILFEVDRQTLHVAEESKQLIGTHFQGSAKAYMALACGLSGASREISRRVCADYLGAMAEIAKAEQTIIRRVKNKLKRGIRRLI